jgi:hypothetical protein
MITNRHGSGVGQMWFSTVSDGAAQRLAPRIAYLAVLSSERLRPDPLPWAQIDCQISAQRGTGTGRRQIAARGQRQQVAGTDRPQSTPTAAVGRPGDRLQGLLSGSASNLRSRPGAAARLRRSIDSRSAQFRDEALASTYRSKGSTHSMWYLLRWCTDAAP